jgi:hypothetical protein
MTVALIYCRCNIFTAGQLTLPVRRVDTAVDPYRSSSMCDRKTSNSAALMAHVRATFVVGMLKKRLAAKRQRHY